MPHKKIHYLGFAFGLMALATSLWQAYELGYRYYSFKRTIATVQKIEIEKHLMDGEYPVYVPRITREYSVDGRTFTGKGFSTSKKYFLAREDAVAFADRFKVGEPMTVFFDPRDVKRSFVVNGFAWVDAVFCLFILVGGLAVTVKSHVQIRDEADAERRPGSF